MARSLGRKAPLGADAACLNRQFHELIGLELWSVCSHCNPSLRSHSPSLRSHSPSQDCSNHELLRFVMRHPGGVAKVWFEPLFDAGKINQRYQCHQVLPRSLLVDDRTEACCHEIDHQNLCQQTILHVLIRKWKRAIRLTTRHAMGSSDSW